MDSITPLSFISPVGQINPQGGQKGQSGQAPTPGQLLKALVVEAKGDQRFILDIGGNKTPARSEAPLTPGQTLQLQVVTTTPQVELKIVTDSLNQFIGKSLTLVGKNIDIGSLFKGLQQQSPTLLSQVSPTSQNTLESFFTLQQSSLDGSSSGPALKQLIENLGLNFEQLLAKGDKGGALSTLKGALLEVAFKFTAAESIADTTNRIITTLELFQLAQLNISNDSLLIFPLPLPFIEQGYLLIEQNSQGDDGRDSDTEEERFSLHITMAELGNLQIDILKGKDNLMIRFRAENQEKAEFIEQFSQELIDNISQIENISITFSADAPDPISDLVRQLVPEGGGVVNTTI